MYQAAAPMGFTADQVRAMSFYDFSCAVTGFSRFHGGDEDEHIGEAEASRLADAIRNPPPWIN